MSWSKFFREVDKGFKRYDRYIKQLEREREKEERKQRRIERDRIKQENSENNPITTRSFQKNQRIEIFSNDNWRCCACGSEYNLRADHIVPWSKGGMTLVRNGQTLCFDCNANKSAKSQENWMRTKYFLSLPNYRHRNMRSSPVDVQINDIKKKQNIISVSSDLVFDDFFEDDLELVEKIEEPEFEDPIATTQENKSELLLNFLFLILLLFLLFLLAVLL